MKTLLIIALLFNLLFATDALSLKKKYPLLSQKTIDYYVEVSKTVPTIDKMYNNFENLSKDEKKELKTKVKVLFPLRFITKYQKLGNDALKEFYSLYFWLINYKAYILVDKYYDDYDFLEGKILATLVHKFNPTGLTYTDTYLWSLVRAKEYDEPLREYPKLLKKIKNAIIKQEIQKHYDYALEQERLTHIFQPKKAIYTIKKVIDKNYFTKLEFDKVALFKELDKIQADDKHLFMEQTNTILKKYLKDEVSIFLQDSSKKTKHKEKSLNFSLKDSALYLRPDLHSGSTYKELQDILKNHTYKKIVLDLRGNEGGRFDIVKLIISAFSQDSYKTIFYIHYKGKRIEMQQIYSSKSLDTTTPLKILIDEHTLRGASYIASVLSKEKRATVEGEDIKIDNIIRGMKPLDNDASIILKYQLAFVFDSDDKEMKIYK